MIRRHLEQWLLERLTDRGDEADLDAGVDFITGNDPSSPFLTTEEQKKFEVQRYQETMRQGFGSDAEMEAARRELAQSMRDRSSRDQDEASRVLTETAVELRATGSPAAVDTAETMELAASLRRSSE